MPDLGMMLLRSVGDPAYWVQNLSAAVFIYIVMGFSLTDIRTVWRPIVKILFSVAAALTIHVGLSVLAFYNRAFAGVGTWLAYLGATALFAVVFCRYELNAKLVAAAFTFATIITTFELGATTGRVLEIGFRVNSLITKLAANILIVLEGVMLTRHRVSKYYVSRHAALLTLFCSGSSAAAVIAYDLFAVHVFPRGGDIGTAGLMSIILAALYAINTACYLMIYRISREETHVLDLSAENQMNKSAQALMAVTEQNLTELHKIKHDSENQYAYMRALLESGDYDGLREYFDELTGTFAEPLVPIVDCGNHALNVIFQMEGAKAREAGVRLDVRAAPPHELPVSELDLVKLYTNVIDNAIEACVSENAEEPSVSVTVTPKGDYLYTRVENPTKKPESFLKNGSTTKADKRIHGKGMTIVSEIVRKNGGTIVNRIENGIFVTEFMLDIRGEENRIG